MTLTVRDRGAARLLKSTLVNVSIKVGVLGTKKHEGSEMTIAQLLEIHELGLGVPERSVLRAWVTAEQASIDAAMAAAYRKILLGKLTPEQAAKILGARFVGQLQTFISDGRVQPPLAPATVQAKGSSVPLVDSGQLKSAISYLVETATKFGG